MKRPSLLGYLKACLRHGPVSWGDYALMLDVYGPKALDDTVIAILDPDGGGEGVYVGDELPWRPGYYLWPDGSERKRPPP